MRSARLSIQVKPEAALRDYPAENLCRTVNGYSITLDAGISCQGFAGVHTLARDSLETARSDFTNEGQKKRVPDIRKDTQEALGVKAGALDNHPAIQTPKLHSWPQLDINPRS
jgi:hypothetical protein